MSWASYLNSDNHWDLCEDCQVHEFGGWPNGVVPIKTKAEAVANNNYVDGDTLVAGNTQVEPPVTTAPLLHPIDSVVYHGAQRLIKAFTNMEQALHTRTPVSMDHFIFDSNPESTTTSTMILKVPTNSRIGVYCSFLLSIGKQLNITCAFAETIIDSCNSVTKSIPLSEMVVFCSTNRLDKLVPFSDSVDTQIIKFGNAIVQLVEKLTAIAKKDTSNANRKIMKSVLHNFFP